MEKTGAAPSPVGGAKGSRHELIDRPGLVSRLEESAERVALICAPAGYGKSTLLRQWGDVDGRAFATLGLASHHNDPTALTAAVCSVIDEVQSVGNAVFAPLATGAARIEDSVIPRLGRALAGRPPIVLALDDVHEVHAEDALRVIRLLADTLAEGSQLAIASRTVPDIQLSRIRASREVLELTAEDLAMTVAEADALFRACGLELEPAEVERLAAGTEGWPAGLYMASLAIESSEDVADAVDGFAGDDRLVASYLREVVLSSLIDEDRNFLVETSVLDSLTGGACDAVTGGQGSGERLLRLAEGSLLMVAMDRSETTFRNHALLQDMLRGELRRRGERVERELHHRAAAWYRDRGDTDLAIGHALAGGDVGAAGAMIWELAAEYESHGGHATLAHWLGQIRPEQVATDPHLCLTMATGAMSMGDGTAIAHWTTAAREASQGLDPEQRRTIAVGIDAIALAGPTREPLETVGARAAETDALLPESSPWRALCRLIEGVAYQLRGDPDRGRAALEAAVQRGAAAAPTIEAVGLAQLALISIDLADEASAARHIDRAFEVIEHHALEHYVSVAPVFAVAGLLAAKKGDPSSAKRDLARSATLLEEIDAFAPWFETETLVTRARAQVLLDDCDEARALLARAGKRMDLTPDATVLSGWIDATWREVEIAAASGGRWPLTAAELRLVHFLPTHLSFKQIADELYVSPNTIKTQAKSIYRKFGVRSRAEAVACARSAGLLGTRDA